MSKNTEPCSKCGNSDRYVKGKFSYCRPCHNEAQKRYLKNKSVGLSYSHKRPPVRSLEYLLSIKGRGAVERAKTHCPKGHPYSGDNVRVEEASGRVHRRCRACERNAKRVRYGLAPEPNPIRLTDLLDES